MMALKHYTERKILKRLNGAVDALVPDITGKLLQAEREQEHTEKEKIEYEVIDFPEGRKPRRRTIGRRLAAGLMTAAAACLLLTAGLSFRVKLAVDSIIGIDVNPSIEITTNRYDKVIEVRALNEDAQTVIGTMDLRNVDYEIAINALIGSLVKNGYFAEAKNYILVSVENADAAKAEQMRGAITSDINNALAAGQRDAVIMNQQLSDTSGAESISNQYGISKNLAAFLEKLVELRPDLSYDQLADMSLSELVEFARQNSINLEAVLDYMEDEDDFDEEDLTEPMDEEDMQDVKKDLEDLSEKNEGSGAGGESSGAQGNQDTGISGTHNIHNSNHEDGDDHDSHDDDDHDGDDHDDDDDHDDNHDDEDHDGDDHDDDDHDDDDEDHDGDDDDHDDDNDHDNDDDHDDDDDHDEDDD